MVWRSAKGWQMEGTAIFGPNMVSFLLTSGASQWYVVGAYMTPYDVPAMHGVEQAPIGAPKGMEMILMGDLHAQLRDPRDKREEDLVMALVDRCLVNMTDHFMTQKRYRGSGIWTWCMQRKGK